MDTTVTADIDFLSGAHRHRFNGEIDRLAAAGTDPTDPGWRALLYLATAHAGLWAKIRPALDYRHGEARRARVESGLSSGERQLVDLAWNLYNGSRPIDPYSMIAVLDPDNFNLAMIAIIRRRGGR